MANLQFQHASHHQSEPNSTRSRKQQLSIVHGETTPPLREITIGHLLDEQVSIRGNNECLVVPWTGARWTYSDIQRESWTLAKALLERGVESGDRIGIMAGNCEEYVATVFAAGYLGAILVVLNRTYTVDEAVYAVEFAECKVLLIAPKAGKNDLLPLICRFNDRGKSGTSSQNAPEMFILKGEVKGLETYQDLLRSGSHLHDQDLITRYQQVNTYDVCNIQYTSGSTGNPKAAMLTHHNILNNAHSIGSRMRLSPSDILCCPPPLFHCFGLVLGLLAVMSHGGCIVLPSETFNPTAVVKSLFEEQCTALHGVPAMFEDVLLALDQERANGNTEKLRLRTGIVAGSPVPKKLMERLVGELGMSEFTSSYGLTEASPTCFNAYTHDTISTRLNTVGKVLPHVSARIINPKTLETVPIGVRGELLMSGYSLFKAYWRNQSKTSDALIRDSDGTVWLRTGDEAVFNEHGYATITGRYKDIIIRGGENIYPAEIEDRLAMMKGIEKAVVVGVKDQKRGEVVGAFVQWDEKEGTKRPSKEEVNKWVRMKLGRHKAPVYVWWFGDEGAPAQVPVTGSGKVRKPELRAVADRLVKKETHERARL